MKRSSDEQGSGRPAAIQASQLQACIEDILGASRFKDYCPNGLQVEGNRPIRRVVCGVTASLSLIRAAHEAEADALLVHHGWFWRGEDARILGPRRTRIAELLASGMHLFAYHLPLDVHPELGNNAQLGRRLDWAIDGRLGDDGLVCWHDLPQSLTTAAVVRLVARRLGRKPLAVGALERPVRRVAWCTGAAQDLLQTAIDGGADLFISGEISERTTHLAREAGVVYLAAGHHATERFGVQALAAELGRRLGIGHQFIDDDNPV